jgi:hypothetical protein
MRALIGCKEWLVTALIGCEWQRCVFSYTLQVSRDDVAQGGAAVVGAGLLEALQAGGGGLRVLHRAAVAPAVDHLREREGAALGRVRERRWGEGGSGVGEREGAASGRQGRERRRGDKGGRKKVRGVGQGSKKRVVTSGWGEAGMNGGGWYEA